MISELTDSIARQDAQAIYGKTAGTGWIYGSSLNGSAAT